MSVASPFYRRLLPAVFFVRFVLHSTPEVFFISIRSRPSGGHHLSFSGLFLRIAASHKKSAASAALLRLLVRRSAGAISAPIPIPILSWRTLVRQRKQQRHHHQDDQQYQRDLIQSVHGHAVLPCDRRRASRQPRLFCSTARNRLSLTLPSRARIRIAHSTRSGRLLSRPSESR